MKVILKKVRIAFPVLQEAKEYTPGDGKPRYSITPLIVKGSDNDKAIEAAIAEVAKEGFGAKAAAMLKTFRGNSQKCSYNDGDTKEFDGFAGHNYLAAHRRKADGPPTLRDKDGKTPVAADSGRIYAGCYCNVIADIYAITKGNQGIFASFSGVQFVADGDAFSGSRARDEDFEDLSVEDEDLMS